MNRIQEIEARLNAILEEIRSIRSMKRGTINEQYFKGYLKGKKGAVTRGPYYVLSRREGAKTVSQRIVSPRNCKEPSRMWLPTESLSCFAVLEEHVERHSDITIAAQQVSVEEAPSMGIFRFDRSGQIVGFDEKPDAARLAEIGSSVPPGSRFLTPAPEKPFVASMGIYLFSRDVLTELLARHDSVDFGHQIIPAAISERVVNAYLFRGYWADVGTVESFYDANIMLTKPRAPFNFYDPRRPIYTHPRYLPGSRLNACQVNEAIVAEGCYLDHARIEQSVVGIRTHVYRDTRITRSVLLGADYYQLDAEAPAQGSAPPLGVARNSVLDRVIVVRGHQHGLPVCSPA